MLSLQPAQSLLGFTPVSALDLRGIPEQSVVLKSSWFSGGDYICPGQPHPVIIAPARGGVLSCQVLLLFGTQSDCRFIFVSILVTFVL